MEPYLERFEREADEVFARFCKECPTRAEALAATERHFLHDMFMERPVQ